MLKFFTDKNSRYASVRRGLEIIMVLILALYPLRHIHIGLDLWDVGYNYANFEYMGTESMDPMWLFSTYLATALGHLFTFLPFGKTLLGLNLYTSLTISFLAVMGYIFFTRRLKYPAFVIFIGEFIAINMCWCPTALLYNYLTFILMSAGIINIFLGLENGKYRYLFVAGVFLGLNVFVRFSNLPEAALILAVWAYGILELIERLKDESLGKRQRRRERIDFLKRTGMRTLFCILGYAASVLGMLLFMTVRYSLDDYVTGIKRLFAMTEDNSGYTLYSMLYSLFEAYRYNLKWLAIMMAALFVGSILLTAGKMLDAHLGFKRVKGKVFQRFTFTGLMYFIFLLIGGGFVYLLCIIKWGEGTYSRFGAGPLNEYLSIIVPSAVFTLIIALWSLGVIFKPGEARTEKLLAGLFFLTIFITPIGSNNGQLSTINNMFLVVPWFMYRVWKLLKREEPEALIIKVFRREHKEMSNKALSIAIVRSYHSYLPLKVIVFLVTALCCVRFIAFGWGFTFAEAKCVENPVASLDDSYSVLKGIRMSPEKAENIKGLMDYVKGAGYSSDKELITYGYIPALSFYLQMPSAFNPWIDLGSYNYAVMQENLNAQLSEKEGNMPVLILGAHLAKYVDGVNDKKDYAEITDGKFKIIMSYIESGEYELVYQNDLFAVLESDR